MPAGGRHPSTRSSRAQAARDAGRDARWNWSGGDAGVRRAGCARLRAGAAAARGGRAARRAGRRAGGALARRRRGDAGRDEGGRRVPAAGSGAIPPTALAWMLEDAGAVAVVMRAAPGAAACRTPRSPSCRWTGALLLATDADTPLPAGRSALAGVRPLHLRLHRHAQGRRRCRTARVGGAPGVWRRCGTGSRRRTACWRSRRSASIRLWSRSWRRWPAGASVALRDARVWSAGELADATERMGITLVNPPTAYWHGLAEDGRAARAGEARRAPGAHRRRGDARRMRRRAGRAPRRRRAAERLRAHRRRRRDRVRRRGGGSGRGRPIGTPLPGRHAAGAGRGMQPAPPGVPGELYIGGAWRWRAATCGGLG